MKSRKVSSRRLMRELYTLRIMIEMFCRAEHRSVRQPHDFDAQLCDECSVLLAYAAKRIEHCHFGAKKPVCAKCPVHCYKPEMRKKIRIVMRYSGPRMLLSHPWLAALHALDSTRRAHSTSHIQGS